MLKHPKTEGPRGTGKSTWLQTHFPQALVFDLLDAPTYNELLADPSRLGAKIPSSYKNWVLIDEVQKIPELLDEVHRLIEKRRLRFALIGSSARKLKRAGVNMLGGRALSLSMHPLTVHELARDFSIAHSLQFGQLPLA